MKQLTWVLAFVVVIELLGVAALSWRPAATLPIPEPDFSRLDNMTRAEMTSLIADVHRQQSGALQQLADRCMAVGYFSEAELYFRMIIQRSPNSFEAALHHGICLDRLGQTESAIAEYQRAASLAKPGQRPSAEVCLYHAGRCCLRDENLEEAERLFIATGDFPLGQYHLAKLLIRSERLTEATALLEPLMTAYPSELKLLQLKIAIARSQGEDAEALVLLEQCERASDRFFPDSTIEFLGLLRTKFGITRERNECYRIAASGRVSEAIPRLQRTLDAEWDLQTALVLIDLHLQQRATTEAVRLLDELTDRTGLLPESLERRGDAELQAGDAQLAAQHWQHSVRLRPESRVYQKLSALAKQTRDQPGAERFAALSTREAGIVAYRRNSLAQAVTFLNQAVVTLPQDPRSWRYLATACRADGRVDEALRAETRLQELISGDAETLP